MFGNFLSLLILCLWTVANGLVACIGMVGCLVLMALIVRTPGLLHLVIQLLFILNDVLVAYLVDCAGSWTCPEYWDAADIALEMPENPYIWTVAGRIFLLLVGLRLLVLVFIYLLQNLLLKV